MSNALRKLLDEKAAYYNQPHFVSTDPICVPRQFTKKQDIEIAGFFAAILAWGNRTTIINNSKRLMAMMDNAPHDFMLNHEQKDLKPMMGFVHRTFNATDLLYCITVLQKHYKKHTSLETAFLPDGETYTLPNIEQALVHFHNYFFSLEEYPERTRKHIATPARRSACKRLCMYLRWMVRKDAHGVDFGIWETIHPAQLIIPLDVHVASVAKRLGLLPEEKANWTSAVAITAHLSEWRPQDPAWYDFALFGLGMAEGL
jgi:uncharacterized protein (TIGR02757 family)